MFQSLFSVAQEVAMQRRNAVQCTPEDTVCVISAASKRVYTGVSHLEFQHGIRVNIHAEIDAMQQMHAGGDTAAEFILLVSIMSLQPILPCGNCAGFILGQAPENANCQVVLPDRIIPLMQISAGSGSANMPPNAGMPAGGQMYGSMPYGGVQPQPGMYAQPPVQGSVSMPYNGAAPAGGSMYTSSYTSGYTSAYVSGMMRSRKASGSKLKEKVSGLANAGKDIGKDEPEESAFIKKLFKK